MRAILMSIRPEWCEKIFNGEKTIEVRKTASKVETPFTVYVYQTKHKCEKGDSRLVCDALDELLGGGKVIGSFVCDKITCCQAYYGSSGEEHLTNLFGTECKRACLSEQELFDYIIGKGGKMGTGWLWHITEPKLFDKPKELSEFYIPCKWYEKGNGCPEDCDIFDYEGSIDYSDDFCQGKRPIKRPPQSWCYVEAYRDHSGDHDTHYGI